MKKKVFIFLLCVLAAKAAYAGKKLVIVIPDAATSGINLSTGKSISSFTLSEFVNSSRFTVVERKNLDKILGELKLQMSGLTEANNAKKVGRLLNADKFMFVTVSRTGGISMVDNEEQFVVKLDVNDIETGVIEVSFVETVNGTNSIYTALKKIISSVIEQTSLTAQVLSVSGDIAYINIGSKDGITKGRTYDIKMLTRVVRDKSGHVIFRKKENVGKLTISDVNAESCEVKIVFLKEGSTINEGSEIELFIGK